jgi:predicted metallo-beta-lactamase superfamily hydrolase
VRVFPIAFDSFGVRSQCTLVVSSGLRILIDPGVALGPTRYGLPPTEAEYQALSLAREKIIEVCKRTDIVIVTHYHYDHHPQPSDDEMYEACFKDKIVIAKDIHENINSSGMKRGKVFESKVKDLAKRLDWGDGKKYDLSNTSIEISPAVWHGEVGSKVGTVIMVHISEDEDSFLFGSDAQNLADPAALRWVLEKNPHFLSIDGYPTIFIGWKKSKKSFQESLGNLGEAIKKIQARRMILDHHIVRDIRYKEKMKPIFDLAESLGKEIITAAEYYGMNNFFLEAWRKEIHEGKRVVDVDSYYRKLYSKITF